MNCQYHAYKVYWMASIFAIEDPIITLIVFFLKFWLISLIDLPPIIFLSDASEFHDQRTLRNSRILPKKQIKKRLLKVKTKSKEPRLQKIGTENMLPVLLVWLMGGAASYSLKYTCRSSASTHISLRCNYQPWDLTATPKNPHSANSCWQHATFDQWGTRQDHLEVG